MSHKILKMKKTFFAFTMLMAIGGLLFISCESGNTDASGFKTTESGLKYKFHTKSNDTVSTKVGTFLTIDLTYGVGDSVLFHSDNLPNAFILPMVESVHVADIYEGIAMMHVGDSATFMCNLDSVFTKLFRFEGPLPQFDSTATDMYFGIKLNKIQTREELDAEREAEVAQMAEEEAKILDEYMAANFPDATPTASGMYYIETKKGNGKNAEAGQVVKVHYTGTFLDGTKFDSSIDRGTPFEFTLGQRQVILGWDEGIAMMKKGGKATLIIPSELAYGPAGRSGIPPSSTLRFEVELVDIVK